MNERMSLGIQEGKITELSPEQLEKVPFKIGEEVTYTSPTSGEFEYFEGKESNEGIDPYTGKVIGIFSTELDGIVIQVKFPHHTDEFPLDPIENQGGSTRTRMLVNTSELDKLMSGDSKNK